MNVRYDHFLEPSLLNVKGRKSISAGSFSWDIPFPGLITFGETAPNDAEHFSKIVGVVIPVSRVVTVSYHYRSFDKGYVSPFSRPFGERDDISEGEKGNYLGVEIKKERVLLEVYADYFSFPPSNRSFATVGKESFVNVTLPITRKFDLLFQVSQKARWEAGIHDFDDGRVQTNYRFAFSCNAMKNFSIAHRMEFVNVSYAPSGYSEKGFLTFVEGKYHSHSAGVRIVSRCIFFGTASYDSRLYQYESDVAGNYSNPPMYGKGIRWYLVAGYEMFDDFLFSFKYSETMKLNEISLGSADDEIKGNVDDRIALQLDFQF